MCRAGDNRAARMSEAAATEAPAAQQAEKPKKEEGSFVWFLVKLVVIVLLFRTLVFTSFSIPSESMMPRLLVGDYLFAAKWPYGFSQASMPLDLDLVPGDGRLFADLPERGDVVIFKHPVDRADYIKRVIGLPGDTVQMVDGQVVLNGTPVPKERVADFVLPQQVDEHCRGTTERLADGGFVCRYRMFRETLPNGVTYNVLDFGPEPQDNTPAVIVPEGRVFVMGDNRDNSEDSRFPAEAGHGVAMVPVENLVGKASFMFFSVDGSFAWTRPWTLFGAIRWGRIGRGI